MRFYQNIFAAAYRVGGSGILFFSRRWYAIGIIVLNQLLLVLLINEIIDRITATDIIREVIVRWNLLLFAAYILFTFFYLSGERSAQFLKRFDSKSPGEKLIWKIAGIGSPFFFLLCCALVAKNVH